MKKQIVRRSLPAGLNPIPDIPEFLARVYAHRGVNDPNQLKLSLDKLLHNESLAGLECALDVLVEALTSQSKIIIVGDFDADGATSTTLAVEALAAMGASNVEYIVPDRFRYGYGLTPEIVELAALRSPDVLITVDNGISSIDGVKKAQSLGMKVVITDHHLPGDELPTADAIVNPALASCEFPSKALAGVGVIFYVLSGLRTRLRGEGWFEAQGLSEPNMGDYLDLVALGTVADLVPLDHNNRILVDQGLRRIRAGRARPGINALFEVAGRDYRQAVTSDLGFAVGPRINAAGRLDDMATGIECLRSRDMLEAKARARVLHDLNNERKVIEQEMRQDAEIILAELNEQQLDRRKGVVLYEPHWHQGVIGILASRVKEDLHRPVIAFAPETDDPDGSAFLKGSGRSIPGLHLRDALDLVAKRHPSLLTKFGGHAMAAGMTMPAQNLQDFELAFDEVVSELLPDSALDAVIYSDGELDSEDLSLENVALLEQSGPWGQQFAEPKFDAVVRIVQKRVLKDRHLKLVVAFPDGALFDAIQFSSPHCRDELERAHIVYRPSVNEFRGRRTVQLMVDYLDIV